MCTMIAASTAVSGAARADASWVRVDEARITYDHATQLWAEHALRVDLAPAGQGRPLTFEIDLASAKALAAALDRVLAEAERAEGGSE